MKTMVFLGGFLGLALGIGIVLVGGMNAELESLGSIKAYQCGYVDGMRFVAERAKIDLGPSPLSGCEKYRKAAEALK